MAIDTQSFLNGLLGTAKHSTPDTRDRNANLSQGSSGNRFDHMLGTAQARRTESGHESMAVRSRQAAHPRTASHATTNSQADRSERTQATARKEKSVRQTERTQPEKVEDFEDGQNEESIEARDQSNQSADLPTELLAAGFPPPFPTEGQSGMETASLSADAAQTAEATLEEVQSGGALVLSSPESQSVSTSGQRASEVTPDQRPGQAPVEGAANAGSIPVAGSTKASDSPLAQSDTPKAVLLAEVHIQDTPGETSTPVPDGSSNEPHLDQDKVQSTIPVTTSHMMAKTTAGADAGNPIELPTPLDSVIRANDVSTGPASSSAGQFLSQDRQASSESRSGLEHPKSNLLPSDDKTLRPQFLDQATGISPSAPPSSDSRIGRGETGQAAIAPVSESERITELRGAFPSAQSVTLDLDPLDMGPLRVRIMMSDQTVHAHIRTEHGELGLNLLQQGPSLEASLRTTGLEMGMLRVTVDQQQQGRGESAWAFQQQGRPGLASDGSAASGEDERASRALEAFYNNGRVSFFA